MHPLSAALVALAVAQGKTADPAESVDLEKLKAHVEYLASPELEGRGEGSGLEKARKHVAEAFQKSGLVAPPKIGVFFQDVPGPPSGKNVLAWLPGADPALRKEVVIVSAHVDHLGKENGAIHPGADDDASGVAALLEIARVLGANKALVKRSVLFAAFDLEERGLVGSQRFVEQPPVPLADVALFVNMDMIGRDLADKIEDLLFVVGAEHSPELKPLVDAADATGSLRASFLGTDIIGIRGDYGPFLAKKVPYLFFSTGEHSDYHQPTDTADRILYPKLRQATQIVLRTVIAAANAPTRPKFVDAKPDLEEVKTIARVLEQVSRKQKAFELSDAEVDQLTAFAQQVEAILKKNAVTAQERETLKAYAIGLRELMRKR
ncbi:MAG TPA: M28 family peptidase [Planctomycetota bacterium]|nr:M28 family peptidase [Planctomycetota bacterium]